MMEKPALQEEKIISCLKSRYALTVSEVQSLSLGADPNSAVYRVVADSEEFFLKLRSGNFEDASIRVPRFLKDNGFDQVIAPIATSDGQLWTQVDGLHLVLFPFVTGRNAISAPLSESQWAKFGSALRVLHTTAIPAGLKSLLRQEKFSLTARGTVTAALKRSAQETFEDPLAMEAAAFLNAKHNEIARLVERTEVLSSRLRESGLEFVLCHTDIFAANLLIDPNGNCYIVDWDTPLLAPKERDLMYIGAGICDVWSTERESELFYRGYGAAEVDPTALVYYRYERIIQDIAIASEVIFQQGADREREFGFLKSNFVPGGVLEIASRSDKQMLAAAGK
jgi:spectinomycin phosphotransferase